MLQCAQGAEIDVRSIVVGDETMSVLEIWGAEYQEQVSVSSKFGVSNL
jgi:phosphoribosylformylglycinamidine synthase